MNTFVRIGRTGRNVRGFLHAINPALSSTMATMNLLKLNLHNHHSLHHHRSFLRRSHQPKLCPLSRFHFSPSPRKKFNNSLSACGPLPLVNKYGKISCVAAATPFSPDTNEGKEEEFEEYLAEDGEVYQKTLRLVECAMFAAVSGLSFLLSNSLAIEKYFSCFFALPILLSTMRWGVAAGRKTMVATAVLLFVLSGPVKAITYLLLHGLLGFAMGTFWRVKANWGASVFVCAIVRSLGALGNVLIASFLIGENILALITINVLALATTILSGMGTNIIPSMNFIYFIFGFLLLLNSVCFVFLLHLLYAVFFTRLGMRDSLRLPKWLEASI